MVRSAGAGLDYAAPLASLSVPRADAIGCVLATEATACQDLQRYSSSAMDGWAINGSGPWIVVEGSPGSDHGPALSVGQAGIISTRGLVPTGAVAALRKESGVISYNAAINPNAAGRVRLTLKPGSKLRETLPGRHIRPVGEEAAAGDVLIPTSTVPNPAHIALAAVAGHYELQVQRKPLVAVVLTGSEVVTGGEPAPGQVRDTFGRNWVPSSPNLAACLAASSG